MKFKAKAISGEVCQVLCSYCGVWIHSLNDLSKHENCFKKKRDHGI